MRCEVLLFAHLADAVGSKRLEIDLADGATVADALADLGRAHPSIAALADRIAVAVDERYVTPDTPLSDGRTIALIPPVSGG